MVFSTVRFKISGECRKTFSANVRYEIIRRVFNVGVYFCVLSAFFMQIKMTIASGIF